MTLSGSLLYPPGSSGGTEIYLRELLEMERVGIIQEDQHVELLGGQLVIMTINPPHAAAVSRI